MSSYSGGCIRSLITEKVSVTPKSSSERSQQMPTRNTPVLTQIIDALGDLVSSPADALAGLEQHFKKDQLIKRVRSTLATTKLTIGHQAHSLTHDGARYFGLMEIQSRKASEDYCWVLGLRNSHDKRFPAGIVAGASVFVCDNLSFSGEVKLARKHTVYVERDLPQLVGRAIGRLADLRDRQEQRFTAYKRREVTDAEAHDLLIRAVDARVLPVTKLPDVLGEWREPRHP